MRTRQALCATALLVTALAGCAGRAAQPAPENDTTASTSPGVGSPVPSVVGSPTRSPTTGGPIPTLPRPTGPPDNPTDRIKPVGWVTGTVTTGGSGPCYTLVTDDGTRYAVHSAAGITLVKDSRMRVSVKPRVDDIHCGPGRPVEMIAAAPLR